jgi:molybdopterin-guanine dinucleotide biosynthesis protein A
LAGGRSQRFAGDKLRASIHGQSSLARVVARVAPIASTTLVATSSIHRRRELSALVPHGVRFLIDRRDRWGPGPAGAIARALESTAEGPVLVVPGDVPWIQTRALARFVAEASDSGADVAAPSWHGGTTENLVQWHVGRDNLEFVTPSGRSPEGLRASEFLRAPPSTLLVPVSRLTARPRTFSHLSVRADVDRPGLRGALSASDRPRRIAGFPKEKYVEGQRQLRAGRRSAASRAFAAEARWYFRAGLPNLAAHAAADARRVASRRGTSESRDVNRPGHVAGPR